jgi:hypothetical protein
MLLGMHKSLLFVLLIAIDSAHAWMQESCAVFISFPDFHCQMEPFDEEDKRASMNATGSPCVYQKKTLFSFKDQYCNLEDGTYHMTIFAFSDVCSPRENYPALHQIYHPGECNMGDKLVSCTTGSCQFDLN